MYHHNFILRVIYFHLKHVYDIDIRPVISDTRSDIGDVIKNSNRCIYWDYSIQIIKKPDMDWLNAFIVKDTAKIKIGLLFTHVMK